MDPARDNRISGREILNEVHRLYQPHREAMAERDRIVCVIRVEAAENDPPDWKARMAASKTSAEQKVKNFTRIGMRPQHIVLAHDVSPAEFAARIATANADPAVASIIVQQPVPARLRQFVQDIEPAKDIDALLETGSPYEACATAEGVCRVVQPFATDRPVIAVVGARGFVGTGVVRLLRQNGLDPIPLDKGDDLSRVADADIVISVTGVPGLLGAEHLRPHQRLVVDTGFHPLPGGGVQGDISGEAAGIPQNITPVPGGIGPVEMAVLVERAVRAELPVEQDRWTYAGRPYEPRTSEPGTAATLAPHGLPRPARPTQTTPSTTAQPEPKPKPPKRER